MMHEMYQSCDIPLVVLSDRAETHAHAAAVAARFGLTICNERSADRVQLVLCDDRLELHGPAAIAARGASVDFSTIELHSGGLSRKQPLGRALGKNTQRVVDATAGMGQDAFLMACMGFDVTAVERSPIVAALLDDGVQRAMRMPHLHAIVGQHLRVIHGDARDVLDTIDRPDAVYVDPMFPPKRRASALPKKELQLLRMVVGDDADGADIVIKARQVTRRVVVKRPTHAPPLMDDVSMHIASKLVRYDVYLQQ